MTELLTAAQMRAIEQAAIASGEVTGLELMERAGRGVVEAILEEWPELALTAHKAVVLCGPGNNGGDGFVVARLLKERGWEVEVVVLGATTTPDAQAMRQRWSGSLRGPSELQLADLVDKPLVVDAMFGIGLTRVIAPEFWGLLVMAQEGGCRIVAVDILSGLDTDSGRVLVEDGYLDHPEVLTVTFERAKVGHYLGQAARISGRLRVVPIGIGRELERQSDDGVFKLTRANGPLGKGSGHKFSHGHALVLSGGAGHGGAARLAARGALRIGAGLVTLGCPEAALAENAAQVTAVMLKAVEDAKALAAVLADGRINALCLGPGLGVERARELLAVVLERRGEPRPTVLDADALTALAADAGLFGLLHEGCVLTPHAGEFARLFPDIAAKLAAPATKGPAYSKVDATREAAARAGCVVLFKGADTVIAGPDGRCAINSAHYERAAPWLATAGSGDVLAGFITGLLARGFGPMQAAETAAWLHVECAIKFGPGLIAEDLPEILPGVLKDLGV